MREKYIKDQERKLKSGGIDRRQFIKSVVAAGVAVPTALAIVDKVTAATPKKGGTFNQCFASGSTNNTLDPMTNEGSAGMLNVNWTWGSNLTEVLEDGSLTGELAESMETADGKTWVFKLRKDVEFHNGKTLSADDVIGSINRHRGEDTTSAIKSLISPVKEIRKDDDNTVVMELEAANVDFPWVLSDYHAVIMPVDGDGNVMVGDGIGTGGYIVENFDPGVSSNFKRNPNYWKDGRAHFDRVENIVVLDSAARQSALLAGAIDAMNDVDLKTVSLLERAPDINILEVTSTQHRALAMRLDTPPFDNYDLRMALKLACKRQELVDKILLGHGQVGNDTDISPSQEFYNTELPQREFDPDKAKHHLKKADMEGIELELHASNAALAGSIEVAQLMQASCAEVGIKVNVNRQPDDGFWSNVWNQKGIGFVTTYWSGRSTNDWMFSACCVEDSSWNESAWKGTEAADKFNALIVQARAELDKDKRREMYWECQRLQNDDGGSLVWGYTSLVHALNKRIGHADKIASNWQLDGARSAERWWIA